MNWLDLWWRKNPKPAPAPNTPDATPDSGTLSGPQWLKAWAALRKIPIKQLFPAVTSVSVVVFLAISGLLAWVVVFLSFIVRLFKLAL
jgi:hypothetical protein